MRIAEIAFPIPLRKTFHYLIPEGVEALPGSLVKAPFGPRRMKGVVVSVMEGNSDRPLKPLDGTVGENPLLDSDLLELAQWMSQRYGTSLGECLKCLIPSAVMVGAKTSAREALNKHVAEALMPLPTWKLTPSQEKAMGLLSEQLRGSSYHGVLLYGVPASGKTEIYRRLISQVLETGGQALFLVPEISLTQPFFKQFSSSLGVPVVLWHSRLKTPERRAAWLGLKSGEVPVVVGARSAALLPFKNLKLAVIDEEQDESFKQEGPAPFYHARDVVFHRARRSNALVVLGSATPSLESFSMAQTGAIELVELAERVSAVPPPSISVLSSRIQGSCLSDDLIGKIKLRLERKEQAILLVNRRGFATLLLCARCGWVDRCPSCGVARIEHEDPEKGFDLLCHHCLKRAKLPTACPQCKKPFIRAVGTGTQKIVAELKKIFPGVRVLRMDKDSLLKDGEASLKIYQGFRNREADILVGTKLVAKGFHFPDVTLVGIVDADTMLNMPDFRASERTAQLLSQAAGRSGRADKPGEVVLQTLSPDHPAIRHAASGDYASFARAELVFRRELGYPPYTSLVRIIWSGSKEEEVQKVSQDAAAVLKDALTPMGAEVLGPAPAVLARLYGKFRQHLLLKIPHEKHELALASVLSLPKSASVRAKIDVDPYDLF